MNIEVGRVEVCGSLSYSYLNKYTAHKYTMVLEEREDTHTLRKIRSLFSAGQSHIARHFVPFFAHLSYCARSSQLIILEILIPYTSSLPPSHVKRKCVDTYSTKTLSHHTLAVHRPKIQWEQTQKVQ